MQNRLLVTGDGVRFSRTAFARRVLVARRSISSIRPRYSPLSLVLRTGSRVTTGGLHHLHRGVAAGRNLFHIRRIVADLIEPETVQEYRAFLHHQHVFPIQKKRHALPALGHRRIPEKLRRDAHWRRRRRHGRTVSGVLLSLNFGYRFWRRRCGTESENIAV